MLNLGKPSWAIGASAQGINASGQIAGVVWGPSSRRAFLWSPAMPNSASGTMVVLPPEINGAAAAVNESGVVTGQAGDLAYVWDGTGAHALPPEVVRYNPYAPSQEYGGGGASVNASGVVAGYTLQGSSGKLGSNFTTAMTWDSVNGTRSLNILSRTSLDTANGINAAGRIIASGSGRGYLLTPSPLPLAPQLVFIAPGDARVYLSWTTSIGATAYKVKRATDPEGPYMVLAASVPGSDYVDTAVVNGTTYYYLLTALNAYGESGNTNVRSARPAAHPQPPTGLVGVPGDGQVALTWNAVPDAASYRVYRSTTGGSPYQFISQVDQPSYLDHWLDESEGTALANGIPYYYVVTAVNTTGESFQSAQATATPVAPPAPPAPTGLTAVAGNGRVTLSWSPSPGAVQYTVKRGTSSGGPYSPAIGGPDAGGIDLGVVNGTTYFYVVTASNSGGESPNSNQVTATPALPPKPAPPTGLAAAPGKKKVSLKWTQSATSGVTENLVYRATKAAGPFTLVVTLGTVTGYVDTSGRSGTKYVYAVTARKAGQESVRSGTATAKPK
jgi:fibronectin type 3 domain-containing protein